MALLASTKKDMTEAMEKKTKELEVSRAKIEELERRAEQVARKLASAEAEKAEVRFLGRDAHGPLF